MSMLLSYNNPLMERVKTLCAQKGIETFQDLASKIGVTSSYIARVMRSGSIPATTRDSLENVFGVGTLTEFTRVRFGQPKVSSVQANTAIPRPVLEVLLEEGGTLEEFDFLYRAGGNIGVIALSKETLLSMLRDLRASKK